MRRPGGVRPYWILAIFGMSLAGAAGADPKGTLTAEDDGEIEFLSAAGDISTSELYGGKVDPEDTISGELMFPEQELARYPAMVLMHASGGIKRAEKDWAEFLLGQGLAVFMVDSFSGRDISEVNDASELSFEASAADTLFALRLLASHPRLDPSRIGVIGFSRGGEAAEKASIERIAAAVLPEGPRFALHVALYGGCEDFGRATGAPLLIIIGDQDSSYKPDQCRWIADRLEEGGGKVDLVVYPGVYHRFDQPGSKRQPKSENWSNCGFVHNVETDEWRTIRTPGPYSMEEVMALSKDCVTLGSTFKYDAIATQKAREEVLKAIGTALAVH